MEIDASIAMFDKSLKYQKYNMSFRARAIYWRGEAYYRLAMFDKARDDYELFMGTSGFHSVELNIIWSDIISDMPILI